MGERASQQGLGGAWYALQQHVSSRDHPQQEPPGQWRAAHDNPLDLFSQRAHERLRVMLQRGGRRVGVGRSFNVHGILLR